MDIKNKIAIQIWWNRKPKKWVKNAVQIVFAIGLLAFAVSMFVPQLYILGCWIREGSTVFSKPLIQGFSAFCLLSFFVAMVAGIQDKMSFLEMPSKLLSVETKALPFTLRRFGVQLCVSASAIFFGVYWVLTLVIKIPVFITNMKTKWKEWSADIIEENKEEACQLEKKHLGESISQTSSSTKAKRL